MEPIISVIIPVYNVEDYLKQCVDSVIAQEVEKIEILLIDDGSTDKSGKICDEYAEKDARISVIHQENAGPSVARNAGLEKAQGEYICFLDSDDFWLKGYLKDVREVLKVYDNIDMFCGRYDKFYDQKPFTSRPTQKGKYFLDSQEAFTALLKNAKYEPGVGACIIKKKIFTEHNLRFYSGIYGEDVDLTPSFLLASQGVYLYENSFYCYRQTRNGKRTVGNYAERSRDLLVIIDKWYKKIQTPQYSQKLREEYCNYLAYQYSIALGMFGLLDKEERQLLWQDIKAQQTILNCATHGKAKLVKRVADVLGFRLTTIILGQWIKRK